jgi:GR25 family glycosyltransferase involved in LPS biosynthesis
MNIYVIAHRQTIRSKELIRYLLNSATHFERIVDDNDVSKRFRKGRTNITRSLLKRDMTLAEYSCAFAHLAAISKFLSSNSQSALILEDDVIPLEDCSSAVNFVEEYDGAIIYQLHTEIISRFKSIQQLRLLQPIDGAYAYLINREAARTILDSNLRFGVLVPSDWHFPPMPFLRIYASVKPYFAHPANRDNSYIQTERELLVSEQSHSGSKFTRKIGLEDYSSSRSLKIPFKYLFGFRLRTYLQEIWIKKFFSIKKAYLNL